MRKYKSTKSTKVQKYKSTKVQKYKNINLKFGHHYRTCNSDIFWATDSIFCIEVHMHCPTKLECTKVQKVQKYKSTKSTKSTKI